MSKIPPLTSYIGDGYKIRDTMAAGNDQSGQLTIETNMYYFTSWLVIEHDQSQPHFIAIYSA